MDLSSAWPARAPLVLGALLLNLPLTGCSDPTAPAPIRITSVSPASGPLAGGTAITITGARFRNVSSVTIGGAPLGSLTAVSAAQITGTTPAASVAGAVDVVVEADGERRTCQGCFTYFDLPMMSGARLAGGVNHTCQLAAAGAAYCWGASSSGRLGNGTVTDQATPAAVSGGLSFVALTAGMGAHTCGLAVSGTAYCWGANSYGQLGDGTTVDHWTPVAVIGGLRFVALDAGDIHTCGVTGSGAAYCWGYNWHGQLGDGTTADRATPVAVSGGLSFIDLDATGHHTCGLTGSGSAYCWGSNDYGELGDGTIMGYFTVPVAVAPLTGGPSPAASRPPPMLRHQQPCLRPGRTRLAGGGRRPDSCVGEP